MTETGTAQAASRAGTAGAAGESFSLGAAVNAEYKQAYGFDGAAATRITAKMVLVPPPTMMLREMGVAEESIRAILMRWPMPSGGLVDAAKLMATTVGRVDGATGGNAGDESAAGESDG